VPPPDSRFDRVRTLLGSGDPVAARKLVWEIKLALEAAGGRFDRAAWAALADAHEAVGEYQAAVAALTAIERQAGWEPLLFLHMLRLRCHFEPHEDLERVLWAKIPDLPKNPAVFRIATGLYHGFKTQFVRGNPVWAKHTKRVEDEWIRLAPDNHHAYAAAANAALARAARWGAPNQRADRRRAAAMAVAAHAALGRSSGATADDWLALSRLEERCGLSQPSLNSAVVAFRLAPGDRRYLTRVARHFSAHRSHLPAEELDAGFDLALAKADGSPDDLAALAGLLFDCGRDARANATLEQCLALDPGHAEAAGLKAAVALTGRPVRQAAPEPARPEWWRRLFR